jgi:hypothetical protein
MHHKLESPIQFQGSLSPPPFLRWFGLKLHLDIFSMTLSMLWCFRQMNKYWFKVVNKSVGWNALEIVWIDDKCYLNTFKKNSLKGDLFKLNLILNSIAWISVWARTTICWLWFKYGFMWWPNFKVTCTYVNFKCTQFCSRF